MKEENNGNSLKPENRQNILPHQNIFHHQKPLKKKPIFWRKLKAGMMETLSLVVLAVTLGGMGWILASLLQEGASVISWSFLTEPSKPYGVPNGGIGNALVGTLLITLTAAVITVPVAVAGGIYLAEFGKGTRLANAIRFCANVMMGIPSIVVGLFIYAVYVIPTGHFSGFAGSLALGVIMLPLIMRTTEDMLLLVPDTQREAALALGMTRMRATLAIICRCARGGLATGILMALARVSGETAPLLFTALWSNTWCDRFFTAPTANIPVLMTEYTTNSPFQELHAAGWGAALVIMACILVLNVTVKVLCKTN
ncbi:MAG: phosphate ABC transporter permease PstA [Planctomycetia bacterium]|nr:phosphate ABC transporter permease PstA [Planctomycetia bacterium]